MCWWLGNPQVSSGLKYHDHLMTHRNDTTVSLLFCRHSKPRSKSGNSDPTKTRANACGAYVSFWFVDVALQNVTVGVVRKYLTHSGHNNSLDEQHVNPIDPDLVQFIRYLGEEVRMKKINQRKYSPQSMIHLR